MKNTIWKKALGHSTNKTYHSYFNVNNMTAFVDFYKESERKIVLFLSFLAP